MASTPGNHESTQRPNPRRGPTRGGDEDHQAVMQRRAIAAGVIVLFLILLGGTWVGYRAYLDIVKDRLEGTPHESSLAEAR